VFYPLDRKRESLITRTSIYYLNETTVRSVMSIPEGTFAPTQLFVFEHDAGRLELLVRILYWIIIGIVMWVYGIIACICLLVQWFHILILARRNEALSNIAKGYLEYMVHVMPYTYFMTDKRPDVMPVTAEVYEVV
jgi:hypothetical protein